MPASTQPIGAWADHLEGHPSLYRLSPAARLLLPVVVSLLAQFVPMLLWILATRTVSTITMLALGLSVLGPVALLGARRYPGPVVLVVSAAAGVDFLLSVHMVGPGYLALAFAIVGAIVRGARLWAWIGVGLAWVATIGVGLLLGIAWSPVVIAATTLGILIVFGVGEGMRNRREHVEQYRHALMQRKQAEVQAERVRIARELHDVLAHSLSQINVQAGVGLHLMDTQPEKAAEALLNIKASSKTALDEVRSVLGVLRAEGGQDPAAPLLPEPDLSRLAGLAASISSQGVAVSLRGSIDDAPQAVQLAIYRIVQESLTNVLRHSGASRATVELSWQGTEYSVVIRDNGAGITEVPTEGRGLLGMRERAELLGGTLELGRSASGGLRVTARIPAHDPALDEVSARAGR